MEFVKELNDWLQVVLKQKLSLKFPWDALKVLEKLKVEESILGQIENGVKWDVPIVLGKNSIIKAPTVIEGPVIIGENAVVGPFAFIRGPVIIGSDCRIGSSEVKHSILMDGSCAAHFSYVGDSILGKKCNLGAGTKLANLRFDGEIVKVSVGEERHSSGLHKLGAILEDGVQAGCNSVLNPGTYVSKNSRIMPGAVVNGFIK